MGMDEHSGVTPVARKGITRREAINYCLVAAAGVAGGGAASWMVRNAMRPNPGDVFPGDAPTDEQWRLWQQRGWVKEGYHYLKLGDNVQCKICPNNCILAPGDRSHCRNKINKDGTLYTLAYANPCAFHLDPVEKKPLFHFLPGSTSFSIATAGCVFRCLNCQNWEISQKTPEQTKDATGPEFRLRPPVPASLSYQDMARLSLFPEDVVALAESLRSPSIAYTYSDPVAYYEYTYDTCKLAREKSLKNILVTCGSIDKRALRDLGQFADAAHVDLKGFDEQTYWKLNAGSLQAILDTLKMSAACRTPKPPSARTAAARSSSAIFSPSPAWTSPAAGADTAKPGSREYGADLSRLRTGAGVAPATHKIYSLHEPHVCCRP